MIKRMLDTNICIYLIEQQPPKVVEKFSQYRKGELIISAITWGELACGRHKHGKPLMDALSSLLDIAPFDAKSAEIFAALSIRHPNRKANFYRLIAAHALDLNIPLVPNNAADFDIYDDGGLVI